MFVTFEGTEGAGKSTQIRLLIDYLRRERKADVVHAVEPGGTPLGRKIRRLLLHSEDPIAPRTEALLYMASRAELVDEVIRPALKRRSIVICDRWLDATVAYQGYGSGVDVRWIERLGRDVTGGLQPTISFFLDVPVRTGLKRVRQRGALDRIESRAASFHDRVRAGYLALVRRHRRFRRIPVTSVEETHRLIREAVDRVF